MNNTRLFSATSLASVLAVSAGLLVPAASHAAVLTASTALELSQADMDFSGINADLAANAVTSATNPVSQYDFDWSADYEDSAWARAAANQDGWMYARAAGENTFKAAAHTQQTLEVTNSTGVAQSYVFDYTILQGELEVSGYDFIAGEYSSASYIVSISLNGVELFASSAELLLDESGASWTSSGTDPGWFFNDASDPVSGHQVYQIQWDQMAGSMDLGVFDAGESFTLTYDIYTLAAGIYTPESYWIGGDDEAYCEGEYGELEEGGCDYVYEPSESFAKFGDPNGLLRAPIAGNVHGTPVVTSVPEPGIWLLMGTGLLGFAVARRRRS